LPEARADLAPFGEMAPLQKPGRYAPMVKNQKSREICTQAKNLELLMAKLIELLISFPFTS
jgi:hypothetical protein